MAIPDVTVPAGGEPPKRGGLHLDPWVTPFRTPCPDRTFMWNDTYTEHVLAWDELAQLDQIGGTIRERRIELGWTQSELAELSGVPQADISRIENDRVDARWSTLQRLLNELARVDAPRRSLANGRRVSTVPAPTGRWTASRQVTKIDRSSK